MPVCRAWRNQVHVTVVSSFQCDVSAMLNLMGIAHMMEYTTEVRACAQGAGFQAVLNVMGAPVPPKAGELFAQARRSRPAAACSGPIPEHAPAACRNTRRLR